VKSSNFVCVCDNQFNNDGWCSLLITAYHAIRKKFLQSVYFSPHFHYDKNELALLSSLSFLFSTVEQNSKVSSQY